MVKQLTSEEIHLPNSWCIAWRYRKMWLGMSLRYSQFPKPGSNPGGLLPCMGYIGMCGPKGYGFSAVLVKNRIWILVILPPFRSYIGYRYLYSSIQFSFHRRSYFLSRLPSPIRALLSSTPLNPATQDR